MNAALKLAFKLACSAHHTNQEAFLYFVDEAHHLLLYEVNGECFEVVAVISGLFGIITHMFDFFFCISFAAR